MRVARAVPATNAEGPFLRYALWVQGCGLRCPGCCNPEMLDVNGGEPRHVDAIVDEIRCARREHGIEGISVLGGEPLEQIAAVTALAEAASADGLGVIVFTGHTDAEARALPGFARLWRAIGQHRGCGMNRCRIGRSQVDGHKHQHKRQIQRNNGCVAVCV